MPKITPFLWFNNQAEEAAKFYVSIFKDSKIVRVSHYGEAGAKASGMPRGAVMTVQLRLAGQEMVLLNGGPHFKLTEAVSLVVNCKTQRELDRYWEKLSAGGEKSHCGWLKDKYGLSWQLVPDDLHKLLNDKDTRKTERFMEAMLQMDKLDIKTLKKAHAGKK